MIILFQSISKKQPLKNGRSGQWDDDAQMYQDIYEAWELFRDRAQVPASLLMNCGYVTKNNVTIQSKMLEIAEYRRDCFCLLDVPMTETQYEDLSDWRTDVQGFNHIVVLCVLLGLKVMMLHKVVLIL